MAQVKMGDPKLLKAEAARKVEALAQAETAKKAKADAKAAAAAAEEARAAVEPAAMFKPEHDALFERESPAYRAFDAEGVPTETAHGVEVSKKMRKKLAKQMEFQAKAHEAYLAKQASS